MNQDQAAFLLNYLLPQVERESGTTARVIEAIPDASKDFRPDAKSKSAFELAWHLVSSEIWLLGGAASGAFGTVERSAPADIKTPADIVAWYRSAVSDLIAKLRTTPADRLLVEVDFHGVFKSPAVTFLTMALTHSIHHRGQLSTYLRPMGSRVPAIFGSSADEQFKM